MRGLELLNDSELCGCFVSGGRGSGEVKEVFVARVGKGEGGGWGEGLG